jgi:N6-adenosine-specific RNA methylase IME4
MPYEIIYADPPWMESGGGVKGGKRGADRHYPLMKTKEIIALPVKGMAAENAHLYLWATNNFLPDALEVMAAWGFKYVTMITWGKDRMGLGQYFRGQTEHCLFGVRGMLPYKTGEDGKRQQGKTLFLAPRQAHSVKPEEMRQMIERVSDRPGFRKLEMFARRPAPGWDLFGNEVEGIDLDAKGGLETALDDLIGAIRG